MCRNVRKLRRDDSLPSDAELEDAARQFVRKISGYRVPARANEVAFERAVSEVALASRRLFESLADRRART